tara:strand:- start:4153 stop:4347 length:195 start_codon:yes stop_codon:yes gene_type:complete
MQKQLGVELNLPNRGTGIPYHDKRAHAPGREPIYLSSRGFEKYQFSVRDSKQLLLIFLFEELQK